MRIRALAFAMANVIGAAAISTTRWMCEAPMRLSAAVLWFAVATPVLGQGNPLHSYAGSYTIAESTLPAPDAEIVFQLVADGLGIHSVWRHGSGDSFYEAHALWGYEPASGKVTVLEVNSQGVVAVNTGGFDDSGVLELRRLSDDGSAVRELRRFTWLDSTTVHMTLDLTTPQRTVHHEVTMVRK